MISSAILLTLCHTLLIILVWRIWYLIKWKNPPIDIFLYSHHLSTWDCIYIVRRNSVLVTVGSERVKVMREEEIIVHSKSSFIVRNIPLAGREIALNTGANATKFFTLATKSWKLVAKLATRMFHHNLTKRSSELKRFAKTNPRQTSSLSLFPKCSTCISIDN